MITVHRPEKNELYPRYYQADWEEMIQAAVWVSVTTLDVQIGSHDAYLRDC